MGTVQFTVQDEDPEIRMLFVIASLVTFVCLPYFTWQTIEIYLVPDDDQSKPLRFKYVYTHGPKSYIRHPHTHTRICTYTHFTVCACVYRSVCISVSIYVFVCLFVSFSVCLFLWKTWSCTFDRIGLKSNFDNARLKEHATRTLPSQIARTHTPNLSRRVYGPHPHWARGTLPIPETLPVKGCQYNW